MAERQATSSFLDWARGLRFPRLFLLTAAVFVADLLLPDLIPFADEILLGLTTLLLGNLRRRVRRDETSGPVSPAKP